MASSASQLFQNHLIFIDVLGKGVLNYVFTRSLPGRDLTDWVESYSDKQLSNREFKKPQIKQLREGAKPSEYNFQTLLLILLKFGIHKLSLNLMKSLKELRASSKESVGNSDADLEDGIMEKIKKVARNYYAIIRELQKTCNNDQRCKLDRLSDGIDQFSSSLVKKYEKDKEDQRKLLEENHKFKEELNMITDGLRRTRDTAANTLDTCLNITAKFTDRYAGTSGETTTSTNDHTNSQIVQEQHSTEGQIVPATDADQTSVLSRQEGAANNQMTSVNQEATTSMVMHGPGHIETIKNKVVVEKGSLAFINMS